LGDPFPTYRVTTADSVKEAKEQLRAQGCDLVLTDMVMPEVGGLELLKYIRLHHPDIPVIVFTGYANFQDAVSAVKMGAFDYLTKPIQIEILQHAIARALEFRRLSQPAKGPGSGLPWGRSPGLAGPGSDFRHPGSSSPHAPCGNPGKMPQPSAEVGQSFLDAIEKLLGATRTSIFLYDDDRDNFSGLAAKGPEAKARVAATVPAVNSLMGYVAAQRRPLLVWTSTWISALPS
jgi:CheY-like chemotaxis protein